MPPASKVLDVADVPSLVASEGHNAYRSHAYVPPSSSISTSSCMMESQPLSTLRTLSPGQKSTLNRVNIRTVADLVLLSTPELVKRCRLSHHEAQEIFNFVCDELAPPLHSLADAETPQDDTFTTGDALIDRMLGGGIRTGKVWEVVGESAAGKTQLTMQLSLCVQLPPAQGGLSGAACVLATSHTLPTHRLLEIAAAHPRLARCGLADVHTLKTPTLATLKHVLAHTLPAFAAAAAARRPVRLVVLDALAELFHADAQVSGASLWERARHLAEVAALLHALARAHRVAVVVVNEVVDAVDRGPARAAPPHEVAYREQARWFGRADGVPGEADAKEAALGLAWANQVNARVMLSRTRRMRCLGDGGGAPVAKRARRGADVGASSSSSSRVSAAGQDGDGPVRVRRMTVVFNSVAPPGSVDYVVAAGGIRSVPSEDGSGQWEPERASPARKVPPAAAPTMPAVDDRGLVAASSETGLDDVGLRSETNVASEGADAAEDGPEGKDEWDAYWKDDDLGSDIYTQLDLEALSSSPPQ